MKHNSKSTLTTKYSAGEQIVMDRNGFPRYNKNYHTMEEKVMGKRKSVLKTATAAALTGLVLTSVSPAYAGTLPVPAASEKSDTVTTENGWSEDGLYWYEDGVLQGLERRGKEIYDPESDAWYWLDAAYCGKKAVSKDVYQESFAGAFADREDGTGKWVRYDENGHMVKGWDETEDGKYYFEPVTGAMAKGEAVIDGTTYVFDETTGIMKDTGWYTADGNEYWCEDGIKQGTEGRGKEIYDPASDAWYWLDAVDNGKKAVSKDVYQESFAGAYADKEDGTGKWVRYDENGKMIKGWNENAAGRYYFDPETGAMAKGKVLIDSVMYSFDKNTGIGTVDLDTNGLVFDGTTDKWWYFNAGVIDYSFNGLCSNEYGTWKITDGTVDFGYNGFAADGENTWYVVNGRVATEYSGTVDGKAVRNGQVMDTIVIQVVHHDRDRTGAVTEGNPDTSGLVGYIEYLAVPVDKEGNITEPVYISYWCPDDYEGFTSGYIITASSVLADRTLIHSKEDLQRDDIRPYIKDGVLNLYMSWFMM